MSISSPVTHTSQVTAQFASRPNPAESGPATFTPQPAQPQIRVKSDAEMWRLLAQTIDRAQKETVNVYHQMLTLYGGFYKDVTEFKARLRNYVEPGSDQNHIKADIGKINYELRALRQSWRDVPLYGPATPKQAERWSKEWRLPMAGATTERGASVVIDTAPIDAMIEATGKVEYTRLAPFAKVAPDSVENKVVSDKVDWLAAQHHAWDVAMGEQHRQIETRVNTLAEQNGHAIGTFNNLNKILSASISAQAESLSGYIRNF
jgi:type III secretion system IpaD/SipD/SspD family effector